MSSFNELYSLRALTHLHPGSGDTGYGHVDKMVQRDPLDGLPTIFPSSLKGAFRELLEGALPPKTTAANGKAINEDHPFVEHVFGTGVKAVRDTARADEARHQGRYRFHQAYLLSLPVRSNSRPFYRASSPVIAAELLERASTMELTFSKEQLEALEWMKAQKVEPKKPQVFPLDSGNIFNLWLEDYQATAAQDFNYQGTLEAIFGEGLALFHHDDLKKMGKNLPVIARNYLENGISQNLWYEEIIPRETRFYFILQGEAHDSELDFAKAMASQVQPANQVQIGANATVGYGLCQLIPLNLEKKSSHE